MEEYVAVFARTSTGRSGYAPDLPGLGVTGESYKSAEQLLCAGIASHGEGLLEDGGAVPKPAGRVVWMPISA